MTDAIELARAALAGTRCWLVGGAVRDELLGGGADSKLDIDLIVDGDVRAAARTLARAAHGTSFELSDEHGAWRVVVPDDDFQIDLNPLRGASVEADLAERDFTVNAIAQPIAGGDLIDPFGGCADLERHALRLVAPGALSADPLRAMRLVRLSCELELKPDDAARSAAREVAPRLPETAAERVFGELRRIVECDRATDGLRLAGELGLGAAVLPELEAMRGVEQNPYHHLDVYGHTLEVLEAAIGLERDPVAAFGPEHGHQIGALLAEPFADGLTRGAALRFGALLHDIAKPPTRAVTTEGRVTFIGHDALGAEMARTVLARLRASERLQSHVAALTLHHLRLGFLVNRQPLSRHDAYHYLDGCSPVTADVTLLSVADRLATRGERAEEAIERHLALARELIGEALRWHNDGRPAPLVRGDDLARALAVEPGPLLGELLAELEEAQYAGEVSNREQAIEHARDRLASR